MFGPNLPSYTLSMRNVSRWVSLIGIFLMPSLGCQLRLARDVVPPQTASTETTSESTASTSSTVAPTALSIAPEAKTLMTGNSFAFTGSGGTLPYSFSLSSGIGSVSPTTGLYTAPATVGSATVRVTDASGQTADAAVTIIPALLLSPSTLTMSLPNTTGYTFTGSGGVPPLSYSILSGPGAIGSTTGAYSATAQTGSTVVQVADSVGNTVTGSVQNIRLRTNAKVLAAVHSGSSLYIGGTFTAVNVTEAPGMIALDTSGNQVLSCDLQSGFNSMVFVTLVSGNSLYAGGTFSTYRGQSANRIAKLNLPDCSLDTTFSPPGSNGFETTVNTLAVSGTSLYVGGMFTAYRGVANSANHVAKLDIITGAIDTTFSPVGPTANGFNGSYLYALAVAGTSLYLGGDFTAYKGVANSANSVAKLDLITGAIDTTFSPVGATANGFNGTVSALTASGASLYIGGSFTAYKGVANSANYLAKINLTTGVIDTTFSPVGVSSNGFNNGVSALTASGTSLYAGGSFSAYKGVANSAINLAKLDLTTGAIDTTFSPVGVNANGFGGSSVTSLAISGTSLFVGGAFTTYKGVVGSTNRIAKLNLTTGAIDTTFLNAGSTNNGFDSGVVYTVFASGSNLYVGGNFTNYGGQSANRIAKLDATTYALDTTFSPSASNGFNNAVNALVISGTSIYVGGNFTDYKGVATSANALAKLNLTTGAIDTTFSPVGASSNGFGSGGIVNAFAVSGTSLYVGGDFLFYRGATVLGIAKLDLTTGAYDTTFSPVSNGFSGTGNTVYALAVSGTSIYAGGQFTDYRAVANAAINLAKLNLTTGVLDTTFSPNGATANGFGGIVYALATSGTSLYAGGAFTAYKGVANSANKLAKLDLTTGVIDTTFSPAGATSNGFDNDVYALTTSGSALYVGGKFSAYLGVANSARRIAKLDLTTGVLDPSFSPPGATSNGFNNIVQAFSINGSTLFVGGLFKNYRGTSRAVFSAPLDLTTGLLGD